MEELWRLVNQIHTDVISLQEISSVDTCWPWVSPSWAFDLDGKTEFSVDWLVAQEIIVCQKDLSVWRIKLWFQTLKIVGRASQVWVFLHWVSVSYPQWSINRDYSRHLRQFSCWEKLKWCFVVLSPEQHWLCGHYVRNVLDLGASEGDFDLLR